MDRQKLLIVVLVAIAMVFVISVGFGARGDNGRPDATDPVEFLKGLRSERFLQLDEGLSTTCQRRSADEVVVAGPCVITAPAPGLFGRPPSVVIASSAPVTAQIQPERGPPLQEVVGGDDRECLQAVLAGGGRVRLEPAGNVNTVVELRGESCPEEG